VNGDYGGVKIWMKKKMQTLVISIILACGTLVLRHGASDMARFAAISLDDHYENGKE